METFGNALVEKVVDNRMQSCITITFRSRQPISRQSRKTLCTQLKGYFPDRQKISSESYFSQEELSEQAIRDAIDDMREDGLPVNGFLDHCNIELRGSTIFLDVRNGLEILKTIRFGPQLAERLNHYSGGNWSVELRKDERSDAYLMENQRKIPEIQKFTPKAPKKPAEEQIKIAGLDLTNKPVRYFHGKRFKPQDLTPMKDLNTDSGKVTIWGDVFATEVKGSRRKNYMISITDYTSSVTLKIREFQEGSCEKWEEIGSGMTLVVRGDYNYDPIIEIPGLNISRKVLS